LSFWVAQKAGSQPLEDNTSVPLLASQGEPASFQQPPLPGLETSLMLFGPLFCGKD